MTTVEELKVYVQEKIAEYPELKEQITDLFQLCLDEIEDGASPMNEIHLCICDIEDSIEEAKQL
jgi:hypothetical protein